MAERLTWNQIKEKYPHQNVGLIDIESGINSVSIKSAIVAYTDKETDYNQLVNLAMTGKIKLRYTTLDEDELVGVIG